ncbi:saccharopine dehydrogenase [Bermanella marisrubri]|uniref:Putative saccharopine dehydrogenase n=1 Tax=Bermanella marisrubri TaxID=207949 RepID=Q1MZY4_9GAMM|nr:saccharopine dehydrogenase NADP-binding domain-containing protein [Bermanella marisrubri]EAT11579.1 putative saccharopine dehydrogenase [Oceanobacter sp. RED65] [Bermanella marisrubri]QIZ84959.1 saccharopine dehydrogenase [Bermanella marisrubri]
MADSQYDIIIFGATSFVGDILTGYMHKTYGTNGEIKWAMAGRSESKLQAIKSKHGAQDVPHFIADASNEEQLKTLADKARVIVSTVGPYALYGEPLVKVCVESGTDYCDLTGEVQWYKRMVDKYEAKAKETGARIVHCSGFDSIPSDLGVYFTQQQAQKTFGEMCHQIDMRVAKLKGGASGGTVASMMNIAKEAAKDPKLRKELQNPYSICPSDHGFKTRQHNVGGAEFDENVDGWIGPFVMAAVNTRVVHRSNVLQDKAYGQDFKYSEAMMMGKGKKGEKRAKSMGRMLKWFMIFAAIAPTRWLLEKFVPKPGEGPSPKEQEEGMFDMRFYGQTPSGKKIIAKVVGDRDPGYGSTAKMLGQAAVCLANINKDEKAGGFWTPASIYQDDLIERLQAKSGLTFEVLGS